MKNLSIVVIAVLSFTLVACDAFKESYDSGPAGGEAVNLTNPAESTPVGETGDLEGGVVEQCVETNVVVKKSDEAKVTETGKLQLTNNFENGSMEGIIDPDLKTLASKIDDATVKIAIVSALDEGNEKLSFVLNKVSDTEFKVCGVNYGIYEGMKLTGGEVTVERFNDGADAATMVNSGSFKFEYAKSSEEGAVTVIKALLKDDAPEVTSSTDAISSTVEGSYYAEGLTEAVVEEAK